MGCPPATHCLTQRFHQTGVKGRGVGEHLISSDGCLGPGQEKIEVIQAHPEVDGNLLHDGVLGGPKEPIHGKSGPCAHPLIPDFGLFFFFQANQQDTELVDHNIHGAAVIRICRKESTEQ